MRRQALGGGPATCDRAADGEPTSRSSSSTARGARSTRRGDLILETRAWRDRLFAERAPNAARVTAARRGIERHRTTSCSRAGMGGMGGGLALNQLLVVMDGIDNPPFSKRILTNQINTLLDASTSSRAASAGARCACRRRSRASEQIYFIGATQRPARAARPGAHAPGPHGPPRLVPHADQARPLDIFDLYLDKVSHDPDLDTPRAPRRDRAHHERLLAGDDRAGLLDGADDRPPRGPRAFGWEDLVDAMTTVESGTAVNVEYVPDESRAVAIHEAGHAVAAHVYMTRRGVDAALDPRCAAARSAITRRSRRRSGSAAFQSEEFGRLIWTLGAMAAERVFYGENSIGVGGDVQAPPGSAAWMVGTSGMAPQPFDLDGKPRRETEERGARARS